MEQSLMLDKIELKRLRSTLRVAIIGAFISYASYELFYIIYSPQIFSPAILVISIYLFLNTILYVLFVKGFYRTAKFALLIILDVTMFVLCFFVFGSKASLHYYFLIFSILPMALWSLRKLLPISLFFILNMILFLLIEYDITYPHLLINFPGELITWFKITTVIINFGLIIYTAWYYTNSNDKKAAELQYVYKQVKEQQLELEQINQELEINILALNLKNEELRKANSTKNKMFSIIAHDLKSPLTSLVGLANLLNERVDKFDMEKIRKYVYVISQSSTNLQNLVVNLLHWAKTQLNSLEVNKKLFKIADLVNENISIAHHDITKKGIKIFTNCDTEIKAYADVDMINTIIRNFLANAIKYTPNGGEIRLLCSSKENRIDFEIRDSGIGMTHDKITELFRIDKVNSTPGTNNERGTGIGLLICHELAELNNCSINVNSELGKGTSFIVAIPAA